MGCDIHPYVEVRQADGMWRRASVKVPRDRNYRAFGKLANVRNGHGFAGLDTGNPVEPISEPRGLPTDTSIRDSADTWLGDHSHSWVLLSELLAVDYNQPVTERGFVSPEAAESFKKYGYPPREWCVGTSDTTWVQIEWQKPLYESASLLPKIIAAICHLGKPDDVRLVFGFDS